MAATRRYLLFMSVMPTDLEPYRTFPCGEFDTVEQLEKGAQSQWYRGQHLTSWDCQKGIPFKAWLADGQTIDLAMQHNVILGRQAAIRAANAGKTKAPSKTKSKPKQTATGKDLSAAFGQRRQA